MPTKSNKGCRDGRRVTPAECTNKRRSTTRNLCLPSIRNVQKIGNKTRRAKNRKRIRNRPLPCQMPCSDRGIRSEEESVAIGRIRPEWYKQKNQYGWWVGRRYRKRELRQGSNGLSVRMSILPPLSGCSCSRVGHSSTQEQERPDSRP